MTTSDKSSAVIAEESTVTPAKTKDPKPQSVKSAPHVTHATPATPATPATHATHATVDHMTQSTHKAVNKLADVANSAATTLGDKTSDLQDTKSSYTRQIRAQIKNSPMGSVTIAVISGFLVGWLLA